MLHVCMLGDCRSQSGHTLCCALVLYLLRHLFIFEVLGANLDSLPSEPYSSASSQYQPGSWFQQTCVTSSNSLEAKTTTDQDNNKKEGEKRSFATFPAAKSQLLWHPSAERHTAHQHWFADQTSSSSPASGKVLCDHTRQNCWSHLYRPLKPKTTITSVSLTSRQGLCIECLNPKVGRGAR